MQFCIFSNFKVKYFCMAKVNHTYLTLFGYIWLVRIHWDIYLCGSLLPQEDFEGQTFRKNAFFVVLWMTFDLCAKSQPSNIYVLTASVDVVEHKIIAIAMVHSRHEKYCLLQTGMFFFKKRTTSNFDPPKL